MELRCAFLHGLLYIQHEGQLFILHLQCPHALHGSHFVLCDDHRYIVAIVAHMTIQQQTIRHVLMTGVHRPRVACRGERNVGHIKAGQHLHHAVNSLGGRGVHALDITVGDLRVLDAGIQRISGHQIFIVFGSACGFIVAVNTNLLLAYFTHKVFLLTHGSISILL